MGLGWYVSLEKAVPGLEAPDTDGKALVHAQHTLAESARRLGLTPLHEFLGTDPREVEQFLEREGLNPKEFPIPEEDWFAPAEGLATVRGLFKYVGANPQDVDKADRVLRDLKAFEGMLVAAEKHQTRFHLSSDLPK